MNFILIPVYSFLYRARGGLIPTGSTQLARVLFWALPVAIWGAFAMPYWGALCGLMAFLSLMIPNGSTVASAKPWAVIGQGLISTARLALILAPVAYFSPYIMLFAPLGMLGGLGFYIGWKIDKVNGCALGEWFTGAVYGLVFALG